MGYEYQLEGWGQGFYLFCTEQCMTLRHITNSVWIDVRKKITRGSDKTGSFFWSLPLCFWIQDNTIIWVKSCNSEWPCFVTSTRASKCRKAAKLPSEMKQNMGKSETSLKFALFWCWEAVTGAALSSLSLCWKYVWESLWDVNPQICTLCIFEVIDGCGKYNYYRIFVLFEVR